MIGDAFRKKKAIVEESECAKIKKILMESEDGIFKKRYSSNDEFMEQLVNLAKQNDFLLSFEQVIYTTKTENDSEDIIVNVDLNKPYSPVKFYHQDKTIRVLK